MTEREVRKGQQVVFRFAQQGLDRQELAAEHAGDDVESGVHVLGVGLGEDGANGGGRDDRGNRRLGVAGTAVTLAQRVSPAGTTP